MDEQRAFRLSDLWRLSWLWRPSGEIARGPYVLAAVALVLVKHGLDRVLFHFLTGRRWNPWHYWNPGSQFGLLRDVGPDEALPFVALAVPFVWFGVVLTLKRLRSAGLSPWLVLAFFVPVLNLILFVVLGSLPRRGRPEAGAEPPPTWLGRLIPHGKLASAAVGLAVTIPTTAVFAWLAASLLGEYGWGLFFGLPFFLGFGSVAVYGYHEPRDFGSCIAVALLSLLLVAVTLLLLAIEGAICILMAAPIGAALAFCGGVVGFEVQRRVERVGDADTSLASVVLLLPVMIGVEHALPDAPREFEVTTVLEIDAPREVVWEHVVAFSELPPPRQTLFRVGIAYPMYARIDGAGVGAIRRCVFSTGAFVEPIEVWDPPHRLEFGVTEQPPAMRELALFAEVHAPHVQDYLEAHRGRFRLVALAGGRTRLEGTTWYTHRIWPERYWRLWSDWILHAIHARVLNHIADLAES